MTPPPTTITSGSKMLAKLVSADAEAAADQLDDPDGDLVARRARPRSPPCRRSPRPRPRARPRAESGPRSAAALPSRPSAVPEASASTHPWSGAVALARRAVDVDHGVAELGTGAVGAAVDLAVDDQPAADSGADGEHHRVAVPCAAPKRCSASTATLASLSMQTGQPEALGEEVADRHVGDRQVDGGDRDPPLAIDRAGDAEPDGGRLGPRLERLGDLAPARSSSSSSVCPAEHSRLSCRTLQSSSTTPTSILVPPRSTPIVSLTPVAGGAFRRAGGGGQDAGIGTISSPSWPPTAKQRPPAASPSTRSTARAGAPLAFRSPDLSGLRERAKRGRRTAAGQARSPPASPRAQAAAGARILRWVGIAAGVWILLSFVAFAVSAQLQKWKLADGAKEVLGGNPFLLGSPQNILVLGTDARPPDSRSRARSRARNASTSRRGRAPPRRLPRAFRADTLMVVRAGGGKFRKLSIPRDSFAEIPGQGEAKINAAYAYGGAEGQVKAVEDFLGIDIDHVVIIDFEGVRGPDRRDRRRRGGHPEEALRRDLRRRGRRPGRDHAAPRQGREHAGRGGGAGLRADPQAERLPGPGKNDCALGYDDLDRAPPSSRSSTGSRGG